ncbi:MAG TPA: thioredoxin [Bacillota bacterium]|nr:thioredoxin [Clostridiales bacterium]HOQ14656.1 thioredoxin [Bacillota bacterium]HPU17069.1 thioredoxin [Bacillota bacterium]
MSIIELTKENFDDEVVGCDKPVIIDFWATWCGPCRMLAPVIDEIASEHDEYKVCKVNVDEEPELASAFNVFSIPTIIVIKDNKITATSVGLRAKHDILAMVQK